MIFIVTTAMMTMTMTMIAVIVMAMIVVVVLITMLVPMGIVSFFPRCMRSIDMFLMMVPEK